MVYGLYNKQGGLYKGRWTGGSGCSEALLLVACAAEAKDSDSLSPPAWEEPKPVRVGPRDTPAEHRSVEYSPTEVATYVKQSNYVKIQ
eukprot:5941970-Amphidinium_carterae.1